MLVDKILVWEAVWVPCGVDRGGAGAIGMQEVATLDHERFYDAVEFRVLVAQKGRVGGGAVPDAELAEVFSGQRDSGGVEKHFDAAKGLACVAGSGGKCVHALNSVEARREQQMENIG